jgi:hypothetical protein
VAALALALVAPAGAWAHGLSSRSDVPLPAWLYGWGAALVLAVSFFAFAVAWKQPRLENAPEHAIARIPVWLEVTCGAFGIAWFALLVYAGFAGSQTPSENLIVTFVYVAFWAGLPLLCALAGDLFRPFNPWRATGRAVGWCARRVWRRKLPPPFEYPDRLGRWPAVVGLVMFGWIELVASSGNDPSFLALAATGYALVQLAGMSLFGVDRWTDRGDSFAVYFHFFGRMSPLAVRNGRLVRRRFLAGLAELQWQPATVTFVCAMIGITAFDGFSEGDAWGSVNSWLRDVFGGLGFSAGTAVQLSYTAGLVASVCLVLLVYRFGVWGMSGSVIERTSTDLGRIFFASLVPIALAYVIAHYFSFVVFQGQGLAALASDPLGNGSDLLGTSGWGIDYGVLSSNSIWYAQVIALVAGHALGLAVAHDKALAVFGQARAAVRSQYWMLVVMICFTNLGLWLLSVANQ